MQKFFLLSFAKSKSTFKKFLSQCNSKQNKVIKVIKLPKARYSFFVSDHSEMFGRLVGGNILQVCPK